MSLNYLISFQFPSPSHWDPEVLNCLPPEIAENLRDKYQRTEKKEVSKTKKSITRTITGFTSTKVQLFVRLRLKMWCDVMWCDVMWCGVM